MSERGVQGQQCLSEQKRVKSLACRLICTGQRPGGVTLISQRAFRGLSAADSGTVLDKSQSVPL